MHSIMPAALRRSDGRRYNELRPVRVAYDQYGYAPASVLLELGNTKVICAVSLGQGVPHFLKGKRTGWLTAEYSMMPFSTQVRSSRDDGFGRKKDGRCVEISRIIGRCLRSVVNLAPLGEQTITVDCEVLQADGGTRTACITAAYLALERAIERWRKTNVIQSNIMLDSIAAVSVGCIADTPILDPNFVEDSNLDADFNFVLTKTGAIVELQGTAERTPITAEQFERIRALAQEGVAQLFKVCQEQQSEDTLLDNPLVMSLRQEAHDKKNK
jgi:ribonuclease PH